MKKIGKIAMAVVVLLAVCMVSACGSGEKKEKETIRMGVLQGDLVITVTKIGIGKDATVIFKDSEEAELYLDMDIYDNMEDSRIKLFAVDIKKPGVLEIWTEGKYDNKKHNTDPLDTGFDVWLAPDKQKNVEYWELLCSYDGKYNNSKYQEDIDDHNLNARFSGDVRAGRVYISVGLVSEGGLEEEDVNSGKTGFVLKTKFTAK